MGLALGVGIHEIGGLAYSSSSSSPSSSESVFLIFLERGFFEDVGRVRFLAGDVDVGGEERFRRGGEDSFVSSSSSPASMRSSSSRDILADFLEGFPGV